MKILLIRMSALGDVIHALPALQTLRCGLPDAEIHWLVDAGAAVLLENDGRIDRLVISRMKQKVLGRIGRTRALANLVAELRAARYDVVIDLQGLTKTALLARLTGARRRIGFQDTKEWTAPFYTERYLRTGHHVTEMNIGLIRRAFPEIPARTAPALVVTETSREFARSYFAPFGEARRVVVNIGGGWITKRYPPDLFCRTFELLTGQPGFPVIHVLSGPGERADAVIAAAGGHARLIPDNTVPEMLALLEAADLVVSADSAPLHAAAALKRPCVGLFGPTDPARNGPHGVRAATLLARVTCRGCFRRACPRPPCMRTIPPESLAAAMAEMLGPI